jgi:hypothetical protein
MKLYEVALVAGIVGGIASGLTGAWRFATTDNVRITVKDKERVTNGDSSKYIVYGDNETFENRDEWLRLKFNSSDVQGQLERGKTYACKVDGFRIPILSRHRNIISCQPVQ